MNKGFPDQNFAWIAGENFCSKLPKHRPEAVASQVSGARFRVMKRIVPEFIVYRPSFRENKLKTLVFNDWNESFGLVLAKTGSVPLTSALLNLPKGKSLGRSKPATNS